jgi:hypothetical protein
LKILVFISQVLVLSTELPTEHVDNNKKVFKFGGLRRAVGELDTLAPTNNSIGQIRKL